jgi:hypothetical protein
MLDDSNLGSNAPHPISQANLNEAALVRADPYFIIRVIYPLSQSLGTFILVDTDAVTLFSHQLIRVSRS